VKIFALKSSFRLLLFPVVFYKIHEDIWRAYGVKIIIAVLLLISLALVAAAPRPAPLNQENNPNLPTEEIKLIFIHYLTGKNWLTDDYGGLGIMLGGNNYFVSDTNYGWGPNGIGIANNTDIPNWMAWFRSDETLTYMNALFNEVGKIPGTRALFLIWAVKTRSLCSNLASPIQRLRVIQTIHLAHSKICLWVARSMYITKFWVTLPRASINYSSLSPPCRWD